MNHRELKDRHTMTPTAFKNSRENIGNKGEPLKDNPKALLELYRRALEQGLSLEGRVYGIILSAMYRPLMDHRARGHRDCPTCGQFYTERQVLTEYMKGHAFYSTQEVEDQFQGVQRIFYRVFGLVPTITKITTRPEYLWEIRVAHIEYAGHELVCDLEALPEVAGTANAELASRVLLDVIFERPGQLSPTERTVLAVERLRVHPLLQVSSDQEVSATQNKINNGVPNELPTQTQDQEPGVCQPCSSGAERTPSAVRRKTGAGIVRRIAACFAPSNGR